MKKYMLIIVFSLILFSSMCVCNAENPFLTKPINIETQLSYDLKNDVYICKAIVKDLKTEKIMSEISSVTLGEEACSKIAYMENNIPYSLELTLKFTEKAVFYKLETVHNGVAYSLLKSTIER